MRKYIVLIVVAVVCLFGAGRFVSAEGAAGVKEKNDGFYVQANVLSNVAYFVDTKARLCFCASGGGLTTIPCENLARRDEWKPVITWVHTEEEEMH